MLRTCWHRFLRASGCPSRTRKQNRARSYHPHVEHLESRELLSGDPILDWNATILNAIRIGKPPPPVAARAMAILSVAQYDAVDLIEPTAALYAVPGLPTTAPVGASAEVAAAAAADRVLDSLFPAQSATFDAQFQAFLATFPDPTTPNIVNSVAFGQAVANAVLAARSSDGSSTSVTYVYGPNDPGVYQATPPNAPGTPPVLPQWPNVTPFGLTSGSQFRPGGPPDLTSVDYTAAFNEVKDLGGNGTTTPTSRTADQTQIALFWADGGGTETPPGHWNTIAAQVAVQQHNTLAENARLFALLNIAEADAGIAAWDAKYSYNYWRPVTAIRNAGIDSNPLTTQDSTWTPLLTTPLFPTYISGHSTFSSAAAAVLSSIYGDHFSFSTTSDALPGVTRSFSSFTAAADEAGQSRIYGGIHFQFDNQDALATGNSVGNWEVQHLLAPIKPHGLLATGADAGSNPEVKVFDTATGAVKFDFYAFDPSFKGGVRVALGDVNGDGVLDILAATGPGTSPEVKVFSGKDGSVLYDFYAFSPSFAGGVYVAAGDVNADGAADIIVGVGAGTNPEVCVLGGGALNGARLRDFYAYDPSFTGGVRVAAGDVNGDGFADIVTGTGAGSSEVRVFSGLNGAKLFDFFAYNSSVTGGICVAAGDVNGDGKADIITGTDLGAAPHVEAFSGQDATLLRSFYAFATQFTGGARVAAADVNGDGRDDVIVGAGPLGGPAVHIFDALTGADLDSFFAFDPSFRGGVSVAAGV